MGPKYFPIVWVGRPREDCGDTEAEGLIWVLQEVLVGDYRLHRGYIGIMEKKMETLLGFGL